jgi:hypothetical protein
LKRWLGQRIKDNPLEFYWPHTLGCDGTKCHTIEHTYTDSQNQTYKIKGCPQYLFHISPGDVRLFLGANRAGKTTCAIVEVAMVATGIIPPTLRQYPKQRRYTRPTKGRIVAADFKKAVGEVITQALDDWIPPKLIVDKERNNQGIFDKYFVRHTSGGISTFDILTHEQDVKVCEGWAGDWVLYDEPPPEAHRVALARGLIDRMGWEMFALTPLSEPWLYDQLYMKSSNLMELVKEEK